jgi:TRAP transporter 4TM/12TM fusion protein
MAQRDAAGAPERRAEDYVTESDSGGRNPQGWQRRVIPAVAVVWALFQLYIASDLPFILQDLVGRDLHRAGIRIGFIFNSSDARVVHLAFAFSLAALAYPLGRRAPRDRIPWYDWLLALIGIVSCFYLIVFKDDIAMRAGLPTRGDLAVSAMGMVILGICVYRTLGLPLLCVALVFLFYVFFGNASILPEAIQWKGASMGKALWHFWMQLEGVFGVALGVSTSMIFLFVLFGAMLEKAGAGNYFIKLAFALLGHLRGGPAKAAVVSSGLSGIYSGSSIANVVSTGVFTIPLMKRAGFTAEKAGAVEVAASTNGQLTPPVMGAAAFLMAEYTGISYLEIVKHAFLPAIISYIALFYIVHLEALKMGLEGLPKRHSPRPLLQRLMGVLLGFIAVCALALGVYYGLGWIKPVAGDYTSLVVIAGLAVAYVFLVRLAARHPELELDDPNAAVIELPEAGPVALTGLYFVVPIVVLIWCIMVERLSPGLSAYLASLVMITVMVTQHALKAIFRGQSNLVAELKRGMRDCINGMIAGSRNMIAISVATGAAGIIVGTVSLTGMHQVVGEFVEFLSGGNLMAMLLLVAVMSLMLGMGLPTTANYIVVSSLMAPVIVSVGAQSGLIVPLIAVHMFVFYFGILADDTPPVGLAAFAAAAISQGDPIRTGIQGFMYDIRTAILPFLFIFNTDLLLINVGPLHAIFVFAVAVTAMLLFAAATQGHFLVRSRLWETLALLLVAFTLFRPGFWLDQMHDPFVTVAPKEILQVASERPEDGQLRVVVSGPDFDKPDKTFQTTLLIRLGKEGTGEARLKRDGLELEVDGDAVKVVEPLPGSPLFDQIGRKFDYYGDRPVVISEVQVRAERLRKEVFYLPALALLGLVVLLQVRRREKVKTASGAAVA